MGYVEYVTTEEEVLRFSPHVEGPFSLELMTLEEMVQEYIRKTRE